MRLDQLPLRQPARIAAIDWARLPAREGQRLRELGFDEGVGIEALHQGPVGRDPIACRVGRMTIAIRRAQAAAVLLEALPRTAPSQAPAMARRAGTAVTA